MGVAPDAVQAEVAAATAPATLGATEDASILPPGVVVYPTGDTWATTVVLNPVGLTRIVLTDDLGSVLVRYLDPDGNVVPQTDAPAALDAQADAGYWVPGEETEVVHPGAVADAVQAEVASASAGATLGAQSDADALPPYTARWLSKELRVGQSWIGGPYRRIPQDQAADQAPAQHFDVQQDAYFTPKDAIDSIPDAAVSLGTAQDAAFTIVEPEVRIRVPSLPFGRSVAPGAYGKACRVVGAGRAVDPALFGRRACSHPFGAAASAR